ncbi:MAG: hypothetical protein WEA77_02800, partial [Hyphomonas sp.]|uniref:hypothetical protein n=1 Tax=Hyphomonas sp. TaxID=87 RepID=UPI00349FF0AA
MELLDHGGSRLAANMVAVMLNDPMDSATRRSPLLPDSLREGVREGEAAGRAAEDLAQSAMPFRARLRASDAVRPQPTLSILTHAAT